jgi:thiol-disulfide isomerase/thioredoxin
MSDTMSASEGQQKSESRRQLPLGFFVLLAVVGVLAIAPAVQKLFWHPKPVSVQRADVVYFYESGCANCASVTPLVEALREARPEWNIVAVDATEAENRKLLSRYGKRYDVKKDDRGRVPALFFVKRRRSVVGREPCFTELTNLLSADLPQKAARAVIETEK